MSITQSVGDELENRGARLWQPIGELNPDEAGVDTFREAYEALHAEFSPPPEVTVRPINAGGVSALIVSPPDEGVSTLLLWKGMDAALIDGTVNGVGRLVRGSSDRLRRLQTGSVRAYAAP